MRLWACGSHDCGVLRHVRLAGRPTLSSVDVLRPEPTELHYAPGARLGNGSCVDGRGGLAVWDWDDRAFEVTGVRRHAVGRRHVVVLDEAGKVRTLGDDALGQCGGQLDLRGVLDMACGYDHSLVADARGVVWAWGLNDDGQTGENPDVSEHRVLKDDRAGEVMVAITADPITVPEVPPARQVAAGADFSVVLSREGRAWTFGSPCGGQLGRDGDGGYLPHPIPHYSFDTVACGASFVIALSDGTPHFWGQLSAPQPIDDFGECPADRGLSHPTPIPFPLPGNRRAISISCADEHALVLDSTGSVFALGTATFGRCGVGDDFLSTWTLINTLPPVSQISAGHSSSLFIVD